MQFLPMLLSGIAAAGLAWVILDIVLRERTVDPHLGRFEQQRRARIRRNNSIFRWFEPWVDEMAAGMGGAPTESQNELSKNLISSGDRTQWTPAEFRAVKRIEAILAAVLMFFLGRIIAGDLFGVMLGIASFFGYEFMATRLVKSNAIRRQIQLKRRFAAAIDLMALMMEVGGSFEESLSVAADENRGHPLGDELAIVRKELELARLQPAVLRDFAERSQDEDIGEVVMAVVEGQELGTPLAEILRNQAEQMRQKRSQWAEKAAEESQVALVFPAMMIMLACLITVAAPFILDAMYNPAGI